MYRTLTQAALSAALATFAFAQTPQTAPNPNAPADPAATVHATTTPSDTAQSFRGILMDASCQAIQNRATTSESAASSEASRSRTMPATTPDASSRYGTERNNSARDRRWRSGIRHSKRRGSERICKQHHQHRWHGRQLGHHYGDNRRSEGPVRSSDRHKQIYGTRRLANDSQRERACCFG